MWGCVKLLSGPCILTTFALEGLAFVKYSPLSKARINKAPLYHQNNLGLILGSQENSGQRKPPPFLRHVVRWYEKLIGLTRIFWTPRKPASPRYLKSSFFHSNLQLSASASLIPIISVAISYQSLTD